LVLVLVLVLALVAVPAVVRSAGWRGDPEGIRSDDVDCGTLQAFVKSGRGNAHVYVGPKAFDVVGETCPPHQLKSIARFVTKDHHLCKAGVSCRPSAARGD
jgi:hypothetical protein